MLNSAAVFMDHVVSQNHLTRCREGFFMFGDDHVGIKYLEPRFDSYFYSFASPVNSHKTTRGDGLRITYHFADNSWFQLIFVSAGKCFSAIGGGNV